MIEVDEWFKEKNLLFSLTNMSPTLFSFIDVVP